MGELASIAKAKRELEEMYLGVPDDSVNLTFQDLVQTMQKQQSSNLNVDSLDSDTKLKIDKPVSTLTKLPSLDFNRALEASVHYPTHNHNHSYTTRSPQQNHLGHLVADLDSLDEDPMLHGTSTHHHNHNHYDHHFGQVHAHQSIDGHHFNHHHKHIQNGHGGEAHGNHATDRHVCHQHHATPCHDSTASMSATATPPYQGRRRPGIPHSNICAVCTTYVYIFRHRCLVCGRVYCRQCVRVGMGERSEGRKCVECLGRRFSQRYIQRAGQIGCCMWYPSTVKQQELKWAEKGPRRSGDSRLGMSSEVSRSRSPAQISPSRARSPSPTPSFVMDSPYSPYTPTRHYPLPL